MRFAVVTVLSLLLVVSEVIHPRAVLAGAQDTSGVKVNPDAQGNYRVGNGVSAPKVVYAPDPELPAAARDKRINVTVVVFVVVDTSGKPKDVHVSKSSEEELAPGLKDLAPDLDRNAVDAAERDRFQPAMFQGKPVPVQIEVKCKYHP